MPVRLSATHRQLHDHCSSRYYAKCNVGRTGGRDDASNPECELDRGIVAVQGRLGIHARFRPPDFRRRRHVLVERYSRGASTLGKACALKQYADVIWIVEWHIMDAGWFQRDCNNDRLDLHRSCCIERKHFDRENWNVRKSFTDAAENRTRLHRKAPRRLGALLRGLPIGGEKPACKPDSVFVWPSLWERRCRHPHAAHPGAVTVPRRFPGGGRCSASSRLCPRPFGLAPDGVYPARLSPSARCALTAPFRPYPIRRSGGMFLWHFPSGRPARSLTGITALWSPDFPLCRSQRKRHAHPAATRRTFPLRDYTTTHTLGRPRPGARRNAMSRRVNPRLGTTVGRLRGRKIYGLSTKSRSGFPIMW